MGLGWCHGAPDTCASYSPWPLCSGGAGGKDNDPTVKAAETAGQAGTWQVGELVKRAQVLLKRP